MKSDDRDVRAAPSVRTGRHVAPDRLRRPHDPGQGSRQDEFDAITAMVADPHGSAMVITGPPGMGKTFLLQAVERVQAFHAHLVRISAAESEWPFSGLTAVVHALTARASGPPTDDLLGQDVSGLMERLSRGDETAQSAAARLVQLVRQVSPSDSMVVLIDDADLMDAASRQAVGSLARRLSGSAVRMVVTAELLPPDGTLDGISLRRLRPLPDDEAAVVGRELVGRRTVPATVMQAAVAGTGGNPQSLKEALEELPAGSGRGTHPLILPLRMGPRTTQVITGDLARSTARTREVLQTMSAAYVTPAMVFTDTDVEEVLQSGHVVRQGPLLRFADARVRSVLYWGMPPQRRVGVHLDLTDRIEDADADLALWHRSFGAEPPSVRALLEAARRFAGRSSQLALELVERAVLVGRLDASSEPILADIADTFFGSAECAAATRLIDLAAEIASDPETSDPETHLRLTTLRLHLAFAERLDVPAGIVASAHRRYGRAHPATTVRLLDHATFHCAELGQFALAEQWWRMADALIDDGGEPDVRRVVGFHRTVGDHLAALRGDRPQVVIDGAVDDQLTPDNAAAVIIRARTYTFLEEYDAARSLCAVIDASPAVRPVQALLGKLFALDNELRVGSMRRASALVDRLSPEDRHSQAYGGLRALLLARHGILQGRVDQVRHTVALVHRMSAASRGGVLGARMRASMGAMAMLAGRHEEAVGLLTDADNAVRQIGSPLFVRHEGDLVESLLLTGDHGGAVEAMSRFEVHHQHHPSQWGVLVVERCRALLLPGRRSVQRLQRLVDDWPDRHGPTHGYGYEYARTLIMLAHRLTAHGHHDEGERQRTRAETVLTELGHDELRAVLVSAPDPDIGSSTSAPAHPPMLDQLDEQERVVAGKVLAGMRNREIAADLYVSLRTVEVRLTKIYRKLGVRSRAQLMALLSNTLVGKAGQDGTG